MTTVSCFHVIMLSGKRHQFYYDDAIMLSWIMITVWCNHFNIILFSWHCWRYHVIVTKLSYYYFVIIVLFFILSRQNILNYILWFRRIDYINVILLHICLCILCYISISVMHMYFVKAAAYNSGPEYSKSRWKFDIHKISCL
jgi:hypothetical protein